MIRTKGEAGSGNIVEAVRHMRTVMSDIKRVTRLDKEEIVARSSVRCSCFSTTAGCKNR